MTGEAARPLLLARLALALYPPSWRARYGDEVLALLAESRRDGPGAAAGLAWHAFPAWIIPPRHLHADRSSRMRASLATVLLAWTVLTGLGLTFAQLTQLQGAIPPAAPVGWRQPATVTAYRDIVTWSYHIFDGALALSLLAIGLGGLPLWLVMLRRAHRERRPRDLIRLLMPVLAPAGYLVALLVLVRLIQRPDGVGQWWFLAIVLGGLAAGIAAAAGPGLALRSLRPRGPAVRFATRAAVVGVASLVTAVAASATAAIALYLSVHYLSGHPLLQTRAAGYSGPPPPAAQLQSLSQYGNSAMLVIYLTLIASFALVAVVGAARGARAGVDGRDYA